jgi:phosphoribosyl-ATP pyrophosphohydrolase/phosphoribosyl-AMP cyclohydrolase
MNPTPFDPSRIDFAKGEGMVPAIVQDADSGRVLMLGYMNPAAVEQTQASGRVTFWSRSRQRLWTKGESSGHGLELVALALDCDADTLLVLARPHGPTCHRGCSTCFDRVDADVVEPALAPLASELARLDAVIAQRLRDRPEGSYTTRLAEGGVRRVAQKVGEEGVETALAGVAQDDDALIAEAADLVFHLGVLMQMRGRSLGDVLQRLRERHR